MIMDVIYKTKDEDENVWVPGKDTFKSERDFCRWLATLGTVCLVISISRPYASRGGRKRRSR